MALDAELVKLLPLREQLQESTQQLRRKPLQRFNMWVHGVCLRRAIKRTMAIYIIIFAAIYAANPNFLQRISEFVGRHMFGRISILNELVYGSAFVAAVGSVLIFPILYGWARFNFVRSMQQLKLEAEKFADESKAMAVIS